MDVCNCVGFFSAQIFYDYRGGESFFLTVFVKSFSIFVFFVCFLYFVVACTVGIGIFFVVIIIVIGIGFYRANVKEALKVCARCFLFLKMGSFLRLFVRSFVGILC